MAFMRLLALVLVAQTIVYLGLFFYLRAAQREKLERDYTSSATEKQRSAFVQAGVDAYTARMRKVLAVVVYGVPLVIFALLILTSNR
ncbi:MAG: hypothetical protein AAGF94_03590 [Pseudomonadota bacterium]